MSYVYFYNNQQIIGAFRTSNGNSYPENWCANSTVEDLNAIGVVCLLEVWPPLEEGNYYNGLYVDNFVELTRTYEQSAIIPQLSGSWSGNATIPVPAGWIVSIAIKENDDYPEPHEEETVDIGTTEGGNDILDDYPITHEYVSLAVNRYFPEPSYIYITTTANYSYSIATAAP